MLLVVVFGCSVWCIGIGECRGVCVGSFCVLDGLCCCCGWLVVVVFVVGVGFVGVVCVVVVVGLFGYVDVVVGECVDCGGWLYFEIGI